MSFKEFDLSDYINALEDFKSNQTETVIQHWGSIENFDLFIQKIKDDEDHVAKLAIQHTNHYLKTAGWQCRKLLPNDD